MSDDIVLTPIAPDEAPAQPPKVAPPAAAEASTAQTVKLKPIIRKPLIRKPVIGGAKPVTLKPATGTPPPPAANPEGAAEVPAAAETTASAGAAPQLKSVTGPLAAQAALRKTGIVAEGILTPAQAQAAKTKTSRISLESAIGVAPSVKSSAPMKTIRLRRPTDLPPAANAIKPVVSPLKPASPAPVAEPAPAPVADADPVKSDDIAAAPTAAAASETASPSSVTEAATEISPTVTQKKTLKLRRPNFKRPTVGGLRKPGATGAATAAVTAVEPTAVADIDTVADIPAVDDIPEIKPLPSVTSPAEADSDTISDAPAWLNAVTLVAGIAALVVAGLCTWSLYTQASGPDAGPNGLASFYSETDHSR